MGIEDFLSPERLAPFKLMENDPQELVIQRYLWNVELAAAFYGPLQIFEVGLRNSIDRSFRAAYGDDWLTRPGLLAPNEVKKVNAALDDLNKRGQPMTRGKVIAQLMLGFWAQLFSRHYEVGSTRRVSVYFWPHRAAEIFPFAPRPMKTRKAMSTRIERVTKFRNRVFHHEPIWKRNDLKILHYEICETARWISPDAEELLAGSRVEEVLKNNPIDLNTKLILNDHL